MIKDALSLIIKEALSLMIKEAMIDITLKEAIVKESIKKGDFGKEEENIVVKEIMEKSAIIKEMIDKNFTNQDKNAIIKEVIKISTTIGESIMIKEAITGNFDNKEKFRNHLTDTEGRTGTYGDYFIIDFFGSDSAKDWIFNLNIIKKVMPYGNKKSKIRVHNGFIKAYKSVRDELHKRFQESEKSKVFLSGFSVGGALATLAAVDFQYNFDVEVKVATTGSPRAGNHAFAKSYDKRIPNTIRYRYGNDIVTSLPPWFFFYKHVKTKKHVGPSFCWWQHKYNLYLKSI